MSFITNLSGEDSESIQSYEDFWKWFQRHERSFYNAVQKKDNDIIVSDFFEKLSPRLNELREGFYYLTGMYDENTVELVFTADGIIKNIVFVEELVQSAPELDGWKFTALKPALSVQDINIYMGNYQFGKDNISFYYDEHDAFPDEIGITVVHTDLTEENREHIVNGTYIYLDNILGELNFASIIDSLSIIGKNEAEKELIPIEKLGDFLLWRQKEFIEKYEGVRHNTENDQHSMLQAELEDGKPILAVINSDLLQWDSKASHPWIMTVEIQYDGSGNNGLPDNETYELMSEIEDAILTKLKDHKGYLNIGRETVDGIRQIYFACSDFRKPSKVLAHLKAVYQNQITIDYSIYKDKYWQSFNHFINHS